MFDAVDIEVYQWIKSTTFPQFNCDSILCLPENFQYSDQSNKTYFNLHAAKVDKICICFLKQTLERSGNALLSTGNVKTSRTDRVIAASFQSFGDMHLLKQSIGTILNMPITNSSDDIFNLVYKHI